MSYVIGCHRYIPQSPHLSIYSRGFWVSSSSSSSQPSSPATLLRSPPRVPMARPRPSRPASGTASPVARAGAAVRQPGAKRDGRAARPNGVLTNGGSVGDRRCPPKHRRSCCGAGMVVANLAPFVSARSPRFGASGVTPGCFLCFLFWAPSGSGGCQSRLPSTSRPGKGRNGDLRGPARRRGGRAGHVTLPLSWA